MVARRSHSSPHWPAGGAISLQFLCCLLWARREEAVDLESEDREDRACKNEVFPIKGYLRFLLINLAALRASFS